MRCSSITTTTTQLKENRAAQGESQLKENITTTLEPITQLLRGRCGATSGMMMLVRQRSGVIGMMMLVRQRSGVIRRPQRSAAE